VVLTDEVSRTLFDEYRAHRQGERGDEEIGWVLLGLREANEAIVLATLPAGAERRASASHVQFNASAQALGSRIVRQQDRRLTILGVAHTHPGSLRHPSDGDYRGDIEWVERLRGGEGVFGIGTADGYPDVGTPIARQPREHVQCLEELSFSWYSLRQAERQYRPVPVSLTIGQDLARPLHALWSVVEEHAEPVDRLCRQQARVTFATLSGSKGPALAVDIHLAEPGDHLRVVLEEKETRYYLVRDGDLLEVDMRDARIDRGVYLVLAELAAQS
jgi:hypothetical protein